MIMNRKVRAKITEKVVEIIIRISKGMNHDSVSMAADMLLNIIAIAFCSKENIVYASSQ
jgi:hypothetical protein